MSSPLPVVLLGVCLLFAGLARAGDPPNAEVAPPDPVVIPGKAKGAWQGEYPIPKPPMPEGPAAPACPAVLPEGGAGEGSDAEVCPGTDADPGNASPG